MTPIQQGFIDKCAKAGINPSVVVKFAKDKGFIEKIKEKGSKVKKEVEGEAEEQWKNLKGVASKIRGGKDKQAAYEQGFADKMAELGLQGMQDKHPMATDLALGAAGGALGGAGAIGANHLMERHPDALVRGQQAISGGVSKAKNLIMGLMSKIKR